MSRDLNFGYVIDRNLSLNNMDISDSDSVEKFINNNE
jgi:hypothetical protein